MSGTDADVAKLAEDIAVGHHLDLQAELGQKICWEAVLYVGWKSNAYKKSRYNALNSKTKNDNFLHLVNPSSDKKIENSDSMTKLSGGQLLAFLSRDPWRLVHVMLSIGGGLAAGTNNGCLDLPPQAYSLWEPGIFKVNQSWIAINLAKYGNWSGGTLRRNGPNLFVFARSMETLKS